MTDLTQFVPRPHNHKDSIARPIYDYLLSRPNHSASTVAICQELRRRGHTFPSTSVLAALQNGRIRGLFVSKDAPSGNGTILWSVATLAQAITAKHPAKTYVDLAAEAKAKPPAPGKVTTVIAPPAAKMAPHPPSRRTRLAAVYDILEAEGTAMPLTAIHKMMPAALQGSSKKTGTSTYTKRALADATYQGYAVRVGNKWRLATEDEYAMCADHRATKRPDRTAVKPVRTVTPKSKAPSGRAIIDSGDTDRAQREEIVTAVNKELLEQVRSSVPVKAALWGVLAVAVSAGLLGYFIGAAG